MVGHKTENLQKAVNIQRKSLGEAPKNYNISKRLKQNLTHWKYNVKKKKKSDDGKTHKTSAKWLETFQIRWTCQKDF